MKMLGRRLLAAFAMWALALGPAVAAQATYSMPLAGPMTFSDFLNTQLNPALGAVLTNNSGASAPSVSGQPGTFQWWMDTNASNKLLKLYDSSAWAPIGYLDPTAHTWTMQGAAAKFTGSSSGTVTVTPQAAAGTPTLTLPTATGTFAVSASSPLAVSATTGNVTCTACVTSSGGGAISGTAPVAVSAGGVVSITGAAGQVLAGSSPAFTATPTLGVAGSTVGTLGFANATSGSITLSPPTGALGTVTVTIPAATDTLVNLGSVQTLSSKTFVAPALGTPASGVATNLTGTASGLTAGNVTTNANLTGVITSSGNATSIASQTGTGTKFVVDNTPTLITPVLGASTGTSANWSSTDTASAFIPSGSSAPTNGLYLPAANTLGLAVSSGGEVQLTSTALAPVTNDGNALGTASLNWSDLFLASGAVVNIANGDWIATHTTGILTVGTGDLRVTTAGANTASVVTVGGSQTLTSKTLTSPTLTTPSLGVATATSINKVAITAPASSATVTIADGKTLTVNKSITLDGTDSTTMTFPSTSATIARTDAANTFTGVQTMTSPAITTPAITGLATGSGVASAPTASTLASRDSNANVFGNTLVSNLASTATAAGTTTLTNASAEYQVFTGVTTQTVAMPAVSTLTVGWPFVVINQSSGAVTVNSSGGNLILSVAAGNTGFFRAVSTSGTTAASWANTYVSSGAGTGTVTSATVAAGPGITVSGTCTVTTSGTCTVAAFDSATTATAAGTTTLTSSDKATQFFTGTTTQTVKLPVVSGLTLGQTYTIVNDSTGKVTVQSSGANTLKVMGGTLITLAPGAPGTKLICTVISTSGTGTSSWDCEYRTPTTDWVQYTPTFTGFGTVSGVSMWSRRVGDTLQIRGYATTGTVTAVEARMTAGFNGTDNNVTSDSTKVAAIQLAGNAVEASAGAFSIYPMVESNSAYLVFSIQGAGTNGTTKATGSAAFSNSILISIQAEFPLTGG